MSNIPHAIGPIGANISGTGINPYDSEGPVYIGGYWYVWNFTFEDDFVSGSISVYSSPDGITWTEQDRSNRPNLGTNTLVLGNFYRGSGNVIDFAYCDGSTFRLKLNTFTVASGGLGSWGTEITGGPVVQGFQALGLTVLGDGTRVVLIATEIGGTGIGNEYVAFVSYNGSWSLPVAASASRGRFAYYSVLDASNRSHGMYVNPSNGNMDHSQFSGGMVSDTVPAIDASLLPFGDYGPWGKPIYNAPLDQIIIPFISNNASHNVSVLVARGTPSASPSFTLETVYDNVIGDDVPEFAGIVQSGDGTSLFVLWSPNNTGDQIVYSKNVNNAGWLTPATLLWDKTTNPPVPTPAAVSPSEIFYGFGNGSITAQIGFTVTGGSGPTCGVQYFLFVPFAPPPPVIGTCPIPISGPPGAPCSNAATNPALDSYLELRKVLVAWKKETHLPVRGKS